MSPDIVLSVSLPDGTTVPLEAYLTSVEVRIAAIAASIAKMSATLTDLNLTVSADQASDQAALTGLQKALEAWVTSKGSAPTTSNGGGAATSSGTGTTGSTGSTGTVGSGSAGTGTSSGTTAPTPTLVLTKTSVANNGTSIWFHGEFGADSVTSIDASLDGGKTWPFTGRIGNEGGGWDTWWYNAPGGTFTPMIRATVDHTLEITAANSVTIVPAASTGGSPATVPATTTSPVSTSSPTLAIEFTPLVVTAGSTEAQSVGTAIAIGLTGTASWTLAGAAGAAGVTINATTGALTLAAGTAAALLTGTITLTDSANARTATKAISVKVLPTGNPANLVLSIGSGLFTFSNIPVGDNTICVVGVQNGKTQYPDWEIIKSSVPLDIDYAGYVHCMSAPGAGPITGTAQCIDFAADSIATVDFSIPVVQVGSQAPTRQNRAFGTLPTSGLIQSNKFLTGTAGGIVGFNITNPTLDAAPVGYTRFAQLFLQGAVPKGETVQLIAPGAVRPIQADTINTYSDGSLKTAVLTVEHDALGSMLTDEFLLGAVTETASTPVDLAAALSATKYNLSVAINFLDLTGAQTSSQTLDIVAALLAAISAGKAFTLQQGALVTQLRVRVMVAGSLYINADVSAFANGMIRADLALRNDSAMSAEGGPIYTSGSIMQNGSVVYSWSKLYQTQYQVWSFECGTAPNDWCNVQLDPAYLMKAAVIQPYDLTIGVDASTVVGYAHGMASVGWLAPLATNGVDTGMPGTGGRPDIGEEDQSTTVAFLTQDPRSIDYCCAQAEASGSAPWNMFDLANDCFVSTANYPDLWVDNRAAPGTPGDPASNGLTQPQTNTPQTWSLDQAHQPDLSFLAWLYTGRRFYLDQVLMQGAWSVVCQYDRQMTIPGTTTVVKQSLWGSQVRGIAWMFRQVSNAGLFAPDGSSYATYFADIMQQNATYGTGMQAYLKSVQGNCWGYLAQDHGQNNFAPWELYYLLSICGLAGLRGYPGWKEITSFFARFAVESCLPQNDGPHKGATWCPRDASSYDLFFGATSTDGQAGGTGIVGTPAQTWAEASYWTVRGGQSNSGATWDAATDTIIPGTPNWSHSAGDYGQLTKDAVVYGVILGLPNAAAALAALLADPPPYTDTATFQLDPTFSFAA